MNSHLEALRESIVAESVAAYPDFTFTIAADKAGNLTSDHRGTWEPEPNPEIFHAPFFTIKHDGECFLVSQYSYVDHKKYKTLKGAMKYITAEITKNCERKRRQKEKEDAEKAFAEKSIRILRDFHGKLTASGLKSKLCLTADHYNHDHICVEADRIGTYIDVTVSHDCQLEMVPGYSRFYATPEAAIDILSILSKKGSA
jgi:hypothetical protein